MKFNFMRRPMAPKAIDIDLGNVGKIMASLLPLARRDYKGNPDPQKVVFSVYGDGSMELSVEIDYGNRQNGRGNSVEDCVAQLRERSLAVARALSSVQPTPLHETE